MESDWRDWDWTRIGLYLEAARGTRPRPEVAAAIGVDPESIYNIEANRRAPKRRKPPTAVALAAYYGWSPDSLQIVGTGGEPVLLKPTPPEGPPAGEPLSAEDREMMIAGIRASAALSDDAKQRMIAWVKNRADTNGNSHDATG